MNLETIDNLMHLVRFYPIEDQMLIKKAYDLANRSHEGQFRQSGAAYITHPVAVACIVAGIQADKESICAALLHDTVEDTTLTLEDIAAEFGEEVANLVDGVTKMSKANFSSKEARVFANTRKIITSISKDVRIMIIRLADRLHNMRTLEFKSDFKQKEISLETMEIFVPVAYCLGVYRIKSELEDLSLKYLKPDSYQLIKEQKMQIVQDSNRCLEQMLRMISNILHDNAIPFDIKLRTKNIYGIYKRLEEGLKLTDIHDVLCLKISLQEVYQCYLALGLIHGEFHPVNEDFKDYICSPKPNMYQGLHTTLFGLDEKLVQAQIRTFKMDKIASFGLTAYWQLERAEAGVKMQEDLQNKYPFFGSLMEINSVFGDNQQFVDHVKSELFADRVYVYTTRGDVIELPKGATAIDFAYYVHTDVGNSMVGAFVNDQPVPCHYVLQNKDRVRIVTDTLASGPRQDWLNVAITTRARRRIKEFQRSA